MPRKVRSVRQQQREFSDELRARQFTWAQVAAEFRDRYGVGVRAALRMVRDWSQRDAAEQWNLRWPADPKTFKNFSHWELWPGPTGHAPSLDVLARLAELYECSVSDLVSDCADFRENDRAHVEQSRLVDLPLPLIQQPNGAKNNSELASTPAGLDDLDTHDLARMVAGWGHRAGSGLKRRALLLKLSAAFTLAASTPAFAGEAEDANPAQPSLAGDLNGVWHSRYKFSSTGRGRDFVGEHYLIMQHKSERFFGESVPVENGSKLRIDLTINGSIATGTWSERTSTTGYYRGSMYHGALQLIVDPMGKTMRGKWVGFDRESQVQSDEWELNWIQQAASKNIQRQFHFRA